MEKARRRKRGKAKAGTISGEGGFPGRAPPQAEARSEARGGLALSRHLLPQQVTQARVRGLSRKGMAVAMAVAMAAAALIDFISLAATASRVRTLSCETLAPLAKPKTGLNCENSSRITSVPPADIAGVFVVSQGGGGVLSVSADCKQVNCGPIQI